MKRTAFLVLSLGSLGLLGGTACTLLFPLEDFGPARLEVDAGSAADATPLDDAGVGGGRYRDEVLADGPVVYLRFGETTGVVARDETGNHDGTYESNVHLGDPGALPGNTAATFMSSLGSRVRMLPGLDFSDRAPFSVEVWARQTKRLEYSFAVDHQTYEPKRIGWMLTFADTHVDFERWSGERASGAYFAAPLTPDQYQHVVGTFDGTRTLLYVDGAVVDENTEARALDPMPGDWFIGGQNCDCAHTNFVGSLDELAIYDRALDPRRVLAHFRAAGR